MWSNRSKYVLLTLVLLSVFCGRLLGQNNMSAYDRGRGNSTVRTGEQQYDIFGNPIVQPEEEKSDSTKTKERKPRKPLESYFFDNEVRSRPNFAWNVNTYMNKVSVYEIDTLLTDFNIDYIFMKKDVGDAYLGNLGAGTVPLNYFRRPDFQDYSFAQPYYAYLYTPENAPFYNVTKPFTQLYYGTAGQRRRAEEMISVIHAQNITPAFGFNVTYMTNKTKGMYTNQATNDTDLSFGISYTGKRYSAHAGYIWNSIDNFENGGIAHDWHLTGTKWDKPENIPVKLGDATYYSTSSNLNKPRSIIKNNTFYMVHSYGIPLRSLTEDDFTMADVPAIYVGYSFEFQNWHRKYSDTAEGVYQNLNKKDEEGNPDPHFPTHPYYEDWYINSNLTRDSIAERKISNRVFVQLQPWDRDGIVGIVDAGIGMDSYRYYMFRPEDFISGFKNTVDKKTSYYIYGSVEGKFRRYFDWGAQARFIPTGYRSGDLDIRANASINVYIKDKPISLTGNFRFRNTEADYWAQNYFSNHFVWDNSFSKENETRIDVKLLIPHINAEVSVHQSILGNKVYYEPYYRVEGQNYLDKYVGADARPVQSSSTVSVTGVYGRKDFRVKGFNFNHRALLQWSTDQHVVPVPLFSAYLSYFYEFNVVKNVLRMKVGLDGWYNTPYYAYGYNAAIGQFYNQREKEVGGYPMVDFFVAAKWKRMRIRLKMAHLNEDLIGTRNYFSILHYPLNKRIFKIAISWGFYD